MNFRNLIRLDDSGNIIIDEALQTNEVQPPDLDTNMCTIAYVATELGAINQLSQYWWHDPELWAGPFGTVAACAEYYRVSQTNYYNSQRFTV
jgi:hypothetical protein